MYFAFQNLRGLKGICRSASIFRVTSDDGTGAGQVASTTGSDALYRPDDEDSPEFQEYLKKLLQMQRNRAKTGFSAPSSRSTDAYFAKLNRIKLEKIARFRAGLPNDDIDVSYKPIDYEYAASEAADVAVIAGVAAGAVTKGAGRVRPITVAEQRLAELAEQSIKEALHGSSTSVASTAGNQTPAARPTSAPAAASISQHFPPVPASAGSKHPSSAPTSAVAAEATSAHAPPQRSFAPARAAPAPAPAPARAAPAPAPAAAASAAHPEALSPASINSRPRSPAAEKVVLKRMLEKDELEVAGKALQLTVMHRGGGPFGSGRLKGDKIDELKAVLTDLHALMVHDAKLASPTAVGKNLRMQREEEEARLPPVKPVKSFSDQLTSATAAIANDEQPVYSNPTHGEALIDSSPPAIGDDIPQQTIAQGLDAFLLHPHAMRIEELQGLRDGLLQCLSMIQASIDAISKDNTPDPSERLLNQHQMELQPPSGVGAEPSFAAESGVPASAPAGPGASSFGDNPPDNLSKEVKLALGLLLKHRGGPGFGHGRFGIHHLPHPSL